MPEELNPASDATINLDTGSLLFFLLALLLFLWLYYGSKKKYEQYVQPLDKKQFPLKSMMNVGFHVMELFRYKYNRKLDREMRKKLMELYDADYNEFYLQAHWAAAATYMVVGGFMTAMFTVAMNGEPFGIVLGLVVTFVLVWSVKQSVDKRVTRRHLQIMLAFPDVINQLIILSGAGLTLRSAWIKVAKEMPMDTPLHREMAKVAEQMENGVSDMIALDDMGNRCNMPEMRRFVSIIIQNMQRGGRDVVYAMQAIGKEMWDNRKAAAKRVAEEAGTKMLFPMTLMLLAVIMLVAAPAVISINSVQ